MTLEQDSVHFAVCVVSPKQCNKNKIEGVVLNRVCFIQREQTPEWYLLIFTIIIYLIPFTVLWPVFRKIVLKTDRLPL